MSVVNPFEPTAPFVQAEHYTWHARPRRVTMIAVHSEENPGKPGSARAVAEWFAGSNSPVASAHVCVDPTSLWCCVHPDDIAWACGPSNGVTYNIECGGYARWTRDEWLTELQTAMLAGAGAHIARAAKYFGLPLRLLDDDAVAAALDGGSSDGGITTHVQLNRVQRARGAKCDLSHTDPGEGFPLDVLLAIALGAAGP